MTDPKGYRIAPGEWQRSLWRTYDQVDGAAPEDIAAVNRIIRSGREVDVVPGEALSRRLARRRKLPVIAALSAFAVFAALAYMLLFALPPSLSPVSAGTVMLGIIAAVMAHGRVEDYVEDGKGLPEEYVAARRMSGRMQLARQNRGDYSVLVSPARDLWLEALEAARKPGSAVAERLPQIHALLIEASVAEDRIEDRAGQARYTDHDPEIQRDRAVVSGLLDEARALMGVRAEIAPYLSNRWAETQGLEQAEPVANEDLR